MYLSWQTTRGRATGRASAVLLVAILVGAGCGSRETSEPAGADGGQAPGAAARPYHTPQQVCTGFARTRFAHDTTRDSGPQAAHERARAWGHPDHFEDLPPGRHPRWGTWQHNRAVIAVQTSPWAGDGPPPDAGDTVHRAVVVAATPVGADGWAGAHQTRTVFCTLTRQHDTWYVANYHIDPGGGSP
jgi:hypothetical protein